MLNRLEKEWLEEVLAEMAGTFVYFWPIDLIGYTAVFLKMIGAWEHSWWAVLALVLLRPLALGMVTMLHSPLHNELYGPFDRDEDDDDEPPDDTCHQN